MSAAPESPVDEYERTLAEQRRHAEAPAVRRAGRFWLSHFAVPMGVSAAAVMTRAWMEPFDFEEPGWWLVGSLASVTVFVTLGYSLAAAGLSAAATVRGWPVLRNRVRLLGISPWLVLSTEAFLVLVALFA